MRKWLLILAASFLLSSVCLPIHAHPPSPSRGWAVPAEEWTPEAQLWLSRAMTAETGWNTWWKVQREQILLAYILVKRYNIRKTYSKPTTFVDTIRDYCNGMKKDRRKFSKRMKWLRALPKPNTHMVDGHEVIDYPIAEPEHWPKNVKWEKHEKYYGRTWVAMGKWAHGHYKHPCPGARHWGGRMDPKRGKMVKLSCSRLYRNNIYGVL